MQTIKVTTTDKGEFHWENFLLAKQEIRLNKLLTELNINPWTRRKVLQLSKDLVTRENIVPISQHPIRIFLHHLLRDDIEYLTNNTTS